MHIRFGIRLGFVALSSLLSLCALDASCKPDATIALTPLHDASVAYAHAIDELRVIGSDDTYERDRFRYFTTTSGDGSRTWLRASPDGSEEVLLDERELRGSFGALLVSPSQRWLAYSTKPHARLDRYAVRVKDLRSGDVISPALDGVDFSFAWSADDTLLYTKLDDKNRPARVFAMQPSAHHIPKLVHDEKDPKNEVLVAETDHAPALFVRGSSGLLAFRLDPSHYLDDPTPIAPAPSAAPSTAPPADESPSVLRLEVVDGGPGGGSLLRTIVDEDRDLPSVR